MLFDFDLLELFTAGMTPEDYFSLTVGVLLVIVLVGALIGVLLELSTDGED